MTTTTPTTEAPTFSLRVCGVLEILRGNGDGHLAIDARTEDGFGAQTLYVNKLEPGWLPVPLLDLLADEWSVRVSPALLRGTTPASLAALFARWVFQPETTWHGARVSEEMVAEATRRIEAFPLAPSAVIDAEGELVALWRLDQPIDFSAGIAGVIDLQARLAQALGASTDEIRYVTPSSGQGIYNVRDLGAHDPRLPIPLAGAVRNWDGPPPLVMIPMCDPSRTYPLAELERAIKETS